VSAICAARRTLVTEPDLLPQAAKPRDEVPLELFVIEDARAAVCASGQVMQVIPAVIANRV
jgi:hypothetical protein